MDKMKNRASAVWVFFKNDKMDAILYHDVTEINDISDGFMVGFIEICFLSNDTGKTCRAYIAKNFILRIVVIDAGEEKMNKL